MEFLLDNATLVLIIAGGCGFFMAWGIGANDVANAMGTSVGAKALTLKQAVFLACIFEFAGAYLAGGEVTKTIRKGIVDVEIMAANPDTMVYGMMAALLAAGCWLLIASAKGWPVSTTHSIVGSIVGFTVVGLGADAVEWTKVGSIVASWVVSPLLSGTIAFMLFKSVQKLILQKDAPFEAARRFLPLYVFLVGFIIALVTLLKGLKHVGLDLTPGEATAYAVITGLIVTVIGTYFLRRIPNETEDRGGIEFNGVERICGVLMIFTACGMAFAHGSNDVANAVGPLAAVVGVLENAGQVAAKSTMPPWILLLGAAGIVCGLSMLGARVMATIGEKITHLTPSRGFSAELAAAGTVVIASGSGLPISTTHTLVGAVLGVGLAQSIDSLDLKVVRDIVISWVVTLPAGAGLAITFFYGFRAILS